MSPRTHRASPEEAQRIAARALQLQCDGCGAPPGTPCPSPGRGRTVCKQRWIGGAIALRREAKAASRTREQAAILAGLPKVTREELEAGRSPAGGFTREQLAEWNVPWPPPAGWLRALLREEDGCDDR